MPPLSVLPVLNPARRPMLWMLVLFTGMVSVVVLRSIFDAYGQLQNDSYYYLRMAYSLVDSGPPLLIHGHYQTTWPPGLPALIAGIIAVSGEYIGLFWASKAANILLLSGALLLLWFRFREDAPAYAALFALAPPLMLFSQTLSEPPFIVGMLAFVLLLERGLQQKSPMLLFGAGLFPLLLFMLRYIGLFALGITLPVALILLMMGFRREAGSLGAGSLLSIMMMGGWFYLSHQLTGLTTGIERTPAPHTPLEGLYHLIRALGDELNLLHVLGNQQPLLFGITLLMQAALLLWLWQSWKKRKLKAAQPVSLFTLLCGVTALLYFTAIALVHIIFGMYSFFYRQVSPASLLLLAGLLHFLLGMQDDGFRRRVRQVMAAAAIVCIVLYGPGYAVHERVIKEEQTRAEYENTVKAMYDAIPPRSVVIYAHHLLYYLRPDIAIEFPLFTPEHAIQESWDDFLQRIHQDYVRNGYNVYIVSIPPDLLRSGTHPSVIEQAREMYEGRIEIRKMQFSKD